ncbi:hypothetical protein RF11_10194 [Thelohanellus kitauei]|uniref:Uncharacterized protein n=1 Tax=Thelohanellus kitauei TaxID=669202 RepID=A0A0C2JJQ3_THEKT|nr:hypothetical protein RF11_10194 [Thelohanellus kitauei]
MDKFGKKENKIFNNRILPYQPIVCANCHDEFKYHFSISYLTYHLRKKHGFVSKTPTLRQLSLFESFDRNGRPLNIVADDGLQEVIRAASGNQCYTLPSRQSITLRIGEMYQDEESGIMFCCSGRESYQRTPLFFSVRLNISRCLQMTGKFSIKYESLQQTTHLSVNKGIKESGLEAVLPYSRKIVGRFKHNPSNLTELKAK